MDGWTDSHLLGDAGAGRVCTDEPGQKRKHANLTRVINARTASVAHQSANGKTRPQLNVRWLPQGVANDRAAFKDLEASMPKPLVRRSWLWPSRGSHGKSRSQRKSSSKLLSLKTCDLTRQNASTSGACFASLKLLPTLLMSCTASVFCTVAIFFRSVMERLRVSGIGLPELRWDFFVLGSDDALLVHRSSASHPILRSRRHCALTTVFTWFMVSLLAFLRFWAACTAPARSSRGHVFLNFASAVRITVPLVLDVKSRQMCFDLDWK